MENSNSNKIYIGVIAVLLILLGLLFYNFNKIKNQKVEQKVEFDETSARNEIERERLEIDLQRMLIGYDTLQTENSQLVTEISSQRTEIEALLKKVKNKNWKVHTLKKEAETLRNIMKGYVVTIDSLNTLNQNLITQVGTLEQGITQRDTKITGLESDKQNLENMVSTGQMLQTGNVATTTIRLRNSGKQVETSRASKTKMIKTCFTIIRNPIAKPGQKTLYMKVIGPDGKVLLGSDGNAQVELGGSNSSYSVKRTIDYNNQQMDVCIFHSIQGTPSRGAYKVEIFENGARIAQSDFTLK